MLGFQNAALLLLLPACILLVALASRRSTRALPAWRRASSLAVRSALVSLLALVMVRPVVTLRLEAPRCTVFLLDLSESVPRRALAAALPDLRRAWDRELAAGGSCGLVAFAGRPEVLRPPGRRPLDLDPVLLDPREARERLAAAAERGEAGAADAVSEIDKRLERLQAAATDLRAAVAAGRALLQDGADNRIILLTDGLDSSVAAADIALPPGTLGLRLEDPRRRDAAVTGITAPTAVRAGEPFDVRVTVHTSQAMEFALSATIDGRPIPAGPKTRSFRSSGTGPTTVLVENVQQDAALPPGLHALQVIVSSAGDEEPRNNAALAALTVTGRPRVLLVEGAAREGEALARMLAAQDIEFVRETPARASRPDAPLESFVAVILAGLPGDALPPVLAASLRAYVEESGGGLLVLGSPALEGPKGFAGKPIEKLLPVSFSSEAVAGGGTPPGPAPPRPPPPTALPSVPQVPPPPQRVLAPTVALLFCVDKSGSMAGKGIALVKDSILASTEILGPRDLVGVLAFDVRPKWVLRFTEAERKDYVRDLVLRLYADGGTHIFPALLEAHQEFRADPRARRSALKHVILLSDGDTLPADFESVVKAMAADGISVTTVCVTAPKFDPTLMSRIAGWGGGRFLFADSFDKVPQIMVAEAGRVVGAAPPDANPQPVPPPEEPKGTPPPPAEPPKEPARPIPVVVKDPHELLQGVDARNLPPVRGLLAAAAKPTASVPLASADGKPVLALWRSGLGRAAVWTPDLAGAWAPEWLPWKDSPKLFAQLVRSISSVAPDAELGGRARAIHEGARAIVRIAPGAPDESIDALDPRTQEAFPLLRLPDGRFEIEVPPGPSGDLRTVRLRRREKDGKPLLLLLGVPRAPEGEFAPAQTSRDLFSGPLPSTTWEELERLRPGDRMSADRRVDPSPWLILAALLLLPLDVALRRYEG